MVSAIDALLTGGLEKTIPSYSDDCRVLRHSARGDKVCLRASDATSHFSPSPSRLESKILHHREVFRYLAAPGTMVEPLFAEENLHAR